MTLRKLNLDTRNAPVSRFIHSDLADYDFDPPYQRGHVWGTERKVNLIKSLLMGIPVGAITVNDRFKGFQEGTGDEDPGYAVVDGKQRLTAILGFIGDEFTVPREWFDDEEVSDGAQGFDRVRYSDLCRSGQRRFGGCTLAVCEAQLPNEDEERILFDLVNFGGVPQGENDSA